MASRLIRLHRSTEGMEEIVTETLGACTPELDFDLFWNHSINI
jgi:hypothetical protein